MTLCDQCGKVLTTRRGRRLHPANFDSAVPHKHANDYEKNIIYALCDRCYPQRLASARAILIKPISPTDTL